ncbi:MAG: hypothetical protein JNL32_03030 [Candidatus Kapabacteria bacterium]|nr:hypothetical protein [Candidatus Kapabacteria bacterium]
MINATFAKIRNSVTRHGAAILMLLVTLGLVGASREVTLQTAVSIVTFEVLAVWLCYLFLYVFSPIDFIKPIIRFFNHSKEGRYEASPTLCVYVVCSVVIAVHVLVAGCVFGIYFTAYKPIP